MAALALALWLAATPALADGIIIPHPPPEVPRAENLAIKYHRVQVTIQDQVATTHVDQVFVNPNPFPVEGTYLFPLPEDAAISRFTLWVDGKPQEGKLLPRDEARRIYEEIVRSQRDPALLEYVGRDAFQARIFPIPAGGERRVELEYTEVLDLEGGLVRYVYPLNTEKFSSRPLEEVAVSVDIRSSRDPIKAVYSGSHDVAVDRESDFHVRVGYEETDVLPDKDFTLYYGLSGEEFGLNLLSYQEPGEKGFFLLLVQANRDEAEDRRRGRRDRGRLGRSEAPPSPRGGPRRRDSERPGLRDSAQREQEARGGREGGGDHSAKRPLP